MPHSPKTLRNAIALACALALITTPAFANGRPDAPPGGGAASHQPAGHGHDGATTTDAPAATSGPDAALPTKAKAYGRYCKGQSKKHSDAADGTSGSPFSQCVKAMAKLANGQVAAPRAACRKLSKHRSDAAPGTRGTPFSQCVTGGKQLLRDHADSTPDEDSTS